MAPSENGAFGDAAGGSSDSKIDRKVYETTPLIGNGAGSTGGMFIFCSDVRLIEAHFGKHLLSLVLYAEFLISGFVYDFVRGCEPFLLASYAVPAPQVQVYRAVANLPWRMKPIIGLISDTVPVLGYNKIPYMVLSVLVALICHVKLGLVPQARLSVGMVVLFLFGIHMASSTCGILMEAKYFERLRTRPENGPALLNLVWNSTYLGQLFAALLVGPSLVLLGPKWSFIALLPCTGSILFPVAANYLGETPQTRQEVIAVRRRIVDQVEVCGLILVVFGGTLVLMFSGMIFQQAWINALVALSVCAAILMAELLFLRPEIAKANAFFLMQISMQLSVDGARFYFFTDSTEAFPDGPHFSKQYYASVMSGVSCLFSLLGLYTYRRFAVAWTCRQLVVLSGLTAASLKLLDAVVYLRLNRAFGVSDKVFVLGVSACQYTVDEWLWMPGVILNSQFCPPGLEATVFALLSGIANIGRTISYMLGAWLLEFLQCQPVGGVQESSQFEHLWLAAVLAAVASVLPLPLAWWLVPAVKQTERVIAGDSFSVTEGSLWRRWRGLEAARGGADSKSAAAENSSERRQ